MESVIVRVSEHSSERVKSVNVIISVRDVFPPSCEVVVGHIGLPSSSHDMSVGDTVLFETPSSGMVEIRVMSMDTIDVEFMVSSISPRPGIAGGFVDDDQGNSPFTPAELEKLEKSISSAEEELGQLPSVTPEQISIISRKLDDLQVASQRLGRKDWLNYTAGVLTSVCISAAFPPELSGALFRLVGSAISWLFDNALVLLP